MCYDQSESKKAWKKINRILRDVIIQQVNWMEGDYTDRVFICDYIRGQFNEVMELLEEAK